ncbi:hypothetical protein [Arhodomonas sp. AD133]|uniref:hypothetical protein n=1 Tax=Arhodomonas sp. AD133 TaxID=3415009 RepID=UPI003EB7B245
MPIVRKDHLAPFLDELDEYHRRLREAVQGTTPSPNLAERYHCNPEQFAEEYADVDLDEIAKAVDHFRVAAAHLKRIKHKAAKPVHHG